MKKYKIYYSYSIEGISVPYGNETIIVSVAESNFENMVNELITKFKFEANKIGYDMKEIDKIEEII